MFSKLLKIAGLNQLFLWLVISALPLTQPVAAQTLQPDLDTLFYSLKTAPNQQAAVEYENQIWTRWFNSGDENIDDLMEQAMKRRRVYDFAGAIELLDQITTLKPSFAEAWNQRATVHFHQEKYEEALIDVAKTLELEPRHFGALAGRAIIRLKQLKPVIARRNIEEAIKLHPFLKERNYFPDLL